MSLLSLYLLSVLAKVEIAFILFSIITFFLLSVVVMSIIISENHNKFYNKLLTSTLKISIISIVLWIICPSKEMRIEIKNNSSRTEIIKVE